MFVDDTALRAEPIRRRALVAIEHVRRHELTGSPRRRRALRAFIIPQSVSSVDPALLAVIESIHHIVVYELWYL